MHRQSTAEILREATQTGCCTGRTGTGLWICTIGEGQATQEKGDCFFRPQFWNDSSLGSSWKPACLHPSLFLLVCPCLIHCVLVFLLLLSPSPSLHHTPSRCSAVQVPLTSIIRDYNPHFFFFPHLCPLTL